jgi:hypothetical protein
MIEVIADKNCHYMIEANPRFWGPSQLFVDAGVNLFDFFLHDFGLIDSKPTTIVAVNKTKYFWFGGFFETAINNHKVSWHSYTDEQYLKALPAWLSSDIYNRDDTRDLFKKELNM